MNIKLFFEYYRFLIIFLFEGFYRMGKIKKYKYNLECNFGFNVENCFVFVNIIIVKGKISYDGVGSISESRKVCLERGFGVGSYRFIRLYFLSVVWRKYLLFLKS